jgi:hypothetical protein
MRHTNDNRKLCLWVSAEPCVGLPVVQFPQWLLRATTGICTIELSELISTSARATSTSLHTPWVLETASAGLLGRSLIDARTAVFLPETSQARSHASTCTGMPFAWSIILMMIMMITAVVTQIFESVECWSSLLRQTLHVLGECFLSYNHWTCFEPYPNKHFTLYNIALLEPMYATCCNSRIICIWLIRFIWIFHEDLASYPIGTGCKADWACNWPLTSN